MAPAPTASEMRAPWTMRLYISRPMKSAPSQNMLLGGAKENLELVAVGSVGAITSAKTAVRMKIATINAPTAPNG
jgi:hypothetical protein